MWLLLSELLACLAIEVICLLEGRTGKQVAVGSSHRDDSVADSCHVKTARLATGEQSRHSEYTQKKGLPRQDVVAQVAGPVKDVKARPPA